MPGSGRSIGMIDGKLPLIFTADISSAIPASAQTALVLTRGDFADSAAVVRHADAAARAQAGGCACCRTSSDLVTVLRQLVIDRARGSVDFTAVVVEAEAAAVERLARDARADPFIAARYLVRTGA